MLKRFKFLTEWIFYQLIDAVGIVNMNASNMNKESNLFRCDIVHISYDDLPELLNADICKDHKKIIQVICTGCSRVR